MPWRQLRLGCHPPGLFDRLKTLPSFEPKELALDMKLEAKAIDGCAEEEYAEWIQLHTRREQRWFEILRYLLAEDDAVDLVAIMFDGPDKLQHLCWRFIDPALRPQDPDAVGGRDPRALRRVLPEPRRAPGRHRRARRPGSDRRRRVRPRLRPDAATSSTSTPGSSSRATSPGPRPTPPSREQDPQIGFSQMMRHVFTLDWTKTVAYAATPSSQGIHLVRARRRHAGRAGVRGAGGRDRAGPPGAPASRATGSRSCATSSCGKTRSRARTRRWLPT